METTGLLALETHLLAFQNIFQGQLETPWRPQGHPQSPLAILSSQLALSLPGARPVSNRPRKKIRIDELRLAKGFHDDPSALKIVD